MRAYQFPCGCSWPILEEAPNPDVLPLLDFNIEFAPEDCQATWDLLGRGDTKGVFQLETPLGRQWTKRLKPISGEHLGALGALLRPGALHSVDKEGVSMTKHYCLRRHGEEELVSYHPAVDPILAPTYGVLTYQEQAMAIAQAVSGFNLQEADSLRKSIAKKLPEEMAKCKVMFIEGAAKTKVVSTEQAAELFGWIEKSQRYQFCKSHAISYGLMGYENAYLKAHFPLAFFTAWLLNARHKQEPQQEILELVNDARLYDITVEPPDIRTMQSRFHTDRRVVKFGLGDIKGIGDAQIEKLTTTTSEIEKQLKKPIGSWSWYEFLVFCSSKLTCSVVSRLIEVGATRFFGLQRQQMLAEFRVWDSLTKKERAWIATNSAN